MKQELPALKAEKPFMNAAGSLGFAPDFRGPVDLEALGAFVTNPISQESRSPAGGQRCVPFPGGFLLHTGYPNPGFRKAVQQYAPFWRRSPVPVIVHILVKTAEQTGQMVRRLEGLEGVMGVEVGLPPGCTAGFAREIAAAAVGELPVAVRLPFENAAEIALALIGLDLAAISFSAPRGTLRANGLVTGRLYGPAVFPMALKLVQELCQTSLPVIGSGGVYTLEQAGEMLGAGAIAVQLEAVFWKTGVGLRG